MRVWIWCLVTCVQAVRSNRVLGSSLLPQFEPLGKGGVSAFLAMSPSQRFAARVDEFQETFSGLRNQTTIQSGSNLAGRSLDEVFQVLNSRADKGVMVSVENLSNRILGEPEFFTRCGYQDYQFMEQSIAPSFQEVFLLHNKDKGLTSSCGSLSWQIMEGLGKPHRLPSGQGLRLYLTWSSLDAVRGNKCAAGKRNEFVLGFEAIELDSSGHGRGSWRDRDVYNQYHTEQMMEETTRQTDANTITALVTSPDGELQVRAILGPDCLSRLEVQVLGSYQAKMLVLAPDEDVYTGDEIWEQMIRQAWLDIVNTVNRDQALYGLPLAPLLLDPLLPEPININQEMVGYQVQLSMWNVSVLGIQDIALDRLTVQRGRALNNLKEEAVLAMGDLEVRGMYQYDATCTAWICVVSQFDSEGPQQFSIKMTNASLSVNIKMNTVNGCNATDSLVLSDIQLPIDYSEVTFNFNNIGTVLGAAVSLIGGFAIDFSKGLLVDAVKQVISSEVPSLLCPQLPINISRMDSLPPAETTGSWKDLLEAAHGGWGMDSLRRDRLAEMLVMKIWSDGLARHFANDSSAIVQALDPFQLLPASEDIHEKGVFKGHIVACELFLTGLKNLKLTSMELVRNSDLTYSALRLVVDLPKASLRGKFRLNHVYVLSAFKAKDSEGDIKADLTGIKVALTVVMNTTKAVTQASDSNIKIDKFEVEFEHKKAVLDVKGLGGKIVQKIANKAIKKVGDKILHMQREAISTEIKNIFWGLAKCLMYNPGKPFASCMDSFWQCLGFKVPFEFPKCPEMYKTADEEIAKFSTYRKYLNDYKAKAAQKATMVEQRSCLAKP